MPRSEPLSSTRCYRCFRPCHLCFCEAIPQVNNRTPVLILQHRRERFHPFNTARVVNQSLDRCQLLAEHNADLVDRFGSMQLSDNVGLLYPGDEARLLTQLTPSECPDQLVIVDGTWHHAKTLMRDIPRLRSLPRYRLAPSSPGRYRIRREPNPHALSTLEATVAALSMIEPETAGLDRLLNVFDQMIDDQLTRSKSNWRQNQRRRRGAPNVPRVLTGDLNNVVVAYGEQEQGNRHKCHRLDRRKPMPIYWIAQRLISGETFQCAIDSRSLEDCEFLRHLRLTPEHIGSPVSINAFRERWQEFLRPGDQLAVYHQSTARLLENIDVMPAPSLILKSIHVDLHDEMPDVFRDGSGMNSETDGDSRTSQRLAGSVAFVRQLNSRYAHP